MFAEVIYYYNVDYIYHESTVKMSPALHYVWNNLFVTKMEASIKEVPCSVPVSWDTYVTTGVYDKENRT